MVDELADHPVPLALVVLRPVLPVRHQFDLVGEAQDVGQLLQQVQAVALKAVVAAQLLVRLLVHHVRVFLCTRRNKQNRTHVCFCVGE